MSKILFTNSYLYKLDPKQWKAKQCYPPLGTIYAAALLRQSGYDVKLFDTSLVGNPNEIIPVVQKEKPKYLVIYEDGFNYLTKMCLTVMREAAFELIRIGKSHHCQVIICSSDSSDHYQKYIAQGADYVLIGEGEITLNELIGSLEKQYVAPAQVEGLAFKQKGEIIKTSKRNVLKDLDELPIPAWDLIDIERYKRLWHKYHGYFSLNIATTRGCPYKCNWCAKPIYGNRYNSRSPGAVVEEIDFLLKNYQPDHFWFCDDIFGLKPGWVQMFRDAIRQRGLKFSYKIQSRVDLLLKEDTVNALAGSGAETVWVGAESGSQKVLDAMDKGTTVKQIFSATRLLKQKNIKVGFFLQFGYLGETKDDIAATISMLMELMPDEIGVSVSYPLPGTGFYEKVKQDLHKKQNWKDSDDLDTMYESTYSKEYYKRLHRYVHKAFQRKRGVINIKKTLTKPWQANSRQIRSALATIYYTPAAMAEQFRMNQLER